MNMSYPAAIDYIGESGIGSAFMSPSIPYRAGAGDPWNTHSANCGDLDIVGQQKPQSLYRNVLWNVTDMEILVHRPVEWNQQERCGLGLWEGGEGQEHVSWVTHLRLTTLDYFFVFLFWLYVFLCVTRCYFFAWCSVSGWGWPEEQPSWTWANSTAGHWLQVR